MALKRTKCVISGMEIEELHRLKNFPVFMGCTEQSSEEDLVTDLVWGINRESGLIQLMELIPLDVLYHEQHAGAIGKTWNEHHEAFASFISKYKVMNVLEIGGAHGILSKIYARNNFLKNWTILEPNPNPSKDVKANYIRGFFDETFVFEGNIDAIVHSHVLEHIYDPDNFFDHLSGFIGSDEYLIFSLPRMEEMLRRKYTNCINFEHTILLNEEYVDYLLAKYQFKTIEKQYFKHDHSIFYCAKKSEDVLSAVLPPRLYEKNKNLYEDYVNYYLNLIDDINKKLQTINDEIYLFGAHIFAQYLIAVGLDTSRITYILDNDPNKQGKRLYGTNLIVQSPMILKDLSKPVVILKAGVYNDEIKHDILLNINSSVKFLE